MKINIQFEFKDGPWGGGNQFLKALREEFEKEGVYEESTKNADVILFNSHHTLGNILKLKFKYPRKKFVHRIDGPLFFVRGRDLEIDKLIFKYSEKIADFSIFQSRWSLEKCKGLGYKNGFHEIIYNAPDKSIFNADNKLPFKSSGKIRLIATSWSGNPNKGFDVYEYLDKNLNFDKYEFVFIGNSPIKFKNIFHINPLSSKDLSEELKKADIYITASKNDPCSNSLIEALTCGLPAVVLNDGGHPELIRKGGEVFEGKEDILQKIEKVSNSYEHYLEKLPVYKIEDTAEKYSAVFEKTSQYSEFKKINIFQYASLFISVYLIKLKSVLKI